jgi:hypothetical protein
MTRKTNKPFVAPLSAQDLRAEAKRLLRERRMPTIEEFTAAVLAARQKYATEIRRARREAGAVVTKPN